MECHHNSCVCVCVSSFLTGVKVSPTLLLVLFRCVHDVLITKEKENCTNAALHKDSQEVKLKKLTNNNTNLISVTNTNNQILNHNIYFN